MKIFNNKKLIKKILITIGILMLYVAGKNIKAPGFDGTIIDIYGSSYLSMLTLMGGGFIEQMSIFALGVGPFINASIVIQLLSMDVIPSLSKLKDDGKKGQKKIEYITFCSGLVIAIIQGYFLGRSLNSYLLNQTVIGYLFVSAIVTVGSAIAYGLGKVIDKWGIGSGMSMIIFANIISNLPHTFRNMFNTLGIIWFIVFVLAYIAIMVAVIFVQTAERRIPVQYSRSYNTTKGKFNHIPLKINSASVMPVIFASSMIQAPQIIVSWINYNTYQSMSSSLNMANWYMIPIYGLLIIAFDFIYTSMILNPKEIASNLAKNSGFIPSIRQGKETENYLKKVINSITSLGAVLIMLLALMPYILGVITGYNVSLGGTGIIIVVGVAMDFVAAIKSENTATKYSSLIGGHKLW